MLGKLKIETENKIANEELIKIKNGEICEYKLKIEFAEPTNPSIYSIIWEEDQVDMYGFWSSKSFYKKLYAKMVQAKKK